MREHNPTSERTFTRQARRVFTCLVLALTVAHFSAPATVMAESLFRASTTYKTQAPITSRSLFTPPIARQVGDLVTVKIEESVETQDQSELKVSRTRAHDMNGTSTYNQFLDFALDKIPFGGKLSGLLSGPTLSDNGSTNQLNSKAEIKRISSLEDNISCQVVQVLPSGDLVIQGQKTMQMNKERQDLMVTGIVKPYYIDRNNEISSKQVANLQIIRAGRGVISRQQNDSISNKVQQFFD